MTDAIKRITDGVHDNPDLNWKGEPRKKKHSPRVEMSHEDRKTLIRMREFENKSYNEILEFFGSPIGLDAKILASKYRYMTVLKPAMGDAMRAEIKRDMGIKPKRPYNRRKPIEEKQTAVTNYVAVPERDMAAEADVIRDTLKYILSNQNVSEQEVMRLTAMQERRGTPGLLHAMIKAGKKINLIQLFIDAVEEELE